MRNQFILILICLIYVVAVNIPISFIGVREHSSDFSFEFFCKKHASIIDFVISSFRFILVSFVFYVSIWTYKELDSTRFFFLLYVFSNLSIVPKIIFEVLEIHPRDRYPIYYTSFIIELLNTCIIVYYSGVNQVLSKPAMQGVLSSWKAFHNFPLGMVILKQYAMQKQSPYEGMHARCLQSYEDLDNLLIRMNIDPGCDYS